MFFVLPGGQIANNFNLVEQGSPIEVQCSLGDRLILFLLPRRILGPSTLLIDNTPVANLHAIDGTVIHHK